MIHRYVCTALDEMRKAIKHLNYISLPISKRHLSSLLEEIQTAVNRMENALEARETFEQYEYRYRKLKKEIKKLKEERKELRKELGEEERDESDFLEQGVRIGRLYRGINEIDNEE